MTNNIALTYFDEEISSPGIVIGADSLMTNVDGVSNGSQAGLKVEIDRVNRVDKSIIGKNSVAVARGFVPGDISESPADFFHEKLAGLENIFDDIVEGTDYSGSALTDTFFGYGVLVAACSPEFLDLYTVSDKRDENKNVARRLLRISQTRDATKVDAIGFLAMSEIDYMVIGMEKVLNKAACINVMRGIIRGNINSGGYCSDLGPITTYDVSFSGISRLETINSP